MALAAADVQYYPFWSMLLCYSELLSSGVGLVRMHCDWITGHSAPVRPVIQSGCWSMRHCVSTPTRSQTTHCKSLCCFAPHVASELPGLSWVLSWIGQPRGSSTGYWQLTFLVHTPTQYWDSKLDVKWLTPETSILTVLVQRSCKGLPLIYDPRLILCHSSGGWLAGMHIRRSVKMGCHVTISWDHFTGHTGES